MPKVRISPTMELPLLAPGLIDVERMTELLADPGADHTPGELARMADAFAGVAEALNAAAKEIVAPQIEGMVGASAFLTDAGVVFRYTAPGETLAVNTAVLRRDYPPKGNEHLYTRRQRQGYISITL